MAVPTTREEFKQYCLRALGHPVIEINVDDDQLDDRIDESLKFFADYHFDGSDKIYYKHLINEADKENRYIYLPENILGAVSIFKIGDPSMRSDDMFNIRYQIALNDLYTLTNVSMVPYYMAMQHLALISELLVPESQIRFSRHKNKLYIDMDWSRIAVGEYLLVEAYEVIDPDVYTDVWGDRWLQKYAIAKIQENWGRNLGKFTGMTLPGGVQFNGDRLWSDAIEEIRRLEQEMVTSYSPLVLDMYG